MLRINVLKGYLVFLIISLSLVGAYGPVKESVSSRLSSNPTTADSSESPPSAFSPALEKHIEDKYKVPRNVLSEIISEVTFHSEEKQIDPVLVLAVIAQESSFRPQVVSNEDYGLMQINKRWQRHRIAEKQAHSRLTDIATNIEMGTEILAEHCQRVKNCEHYKVLRRYNGVKKNPYPELVLAHYHEFHALNG